MRIAVHSKLDQKINLESFDYILKKLDSLPFEVFISKDFYKLLETSNRILKFKEVFNSNKDLNPEIEYFLSIGGDGTLLDTITYVQDSGIKIVGINLGRMGFLSSISFEMLDSALEDLLLGQIKTEKRVLLKLDTENELFDNLKFALNDFAILKRDTSSMIKIKAYVDGEYLNTYWGDGLIVSTPSGSTAYSLSVGGPVVTPGSSNFIISPVCPHNLNVRPLIVSDNCRLSFKVETRSNNYLLSLDSRSEKVNSLERISVSKCSFTINLVQFRNNSFFNTLRKKLNWGLDLRN